MTNPTESGMTCEQLADVLPDLLERELDERVRAQAEAHARVCGECGPLIADLRKLRVEAANLPELAPSRDLWAGIAARIETPVVEIVPGGRAPAAHEGNAPNDAARRRLPPAWMGLAAAGLVAITAAITHEVTKSTIAVNSPVASAPAGSARTPDAVVASTSSSRAQEPTAPDTMLATRPTPSTLVANRPTAEQAYDAEIKRLRVIVASRRASLDSVTVAVIEKNLKVIDDAIAQCRAALQRDPASRFLLESLNDALDTKVRLLRTAATLPARS